MPGPGRRIRRVCMGTLVHHEHTVRLSLDLKAGTNRQALPWAWAPAAGRAARPGTQSPRP